MNHESPSYGSQLRIYSEYDTVTPAGRGFESVWHFAIIYRPRAKQLHEHTHGTLGTKR